MTRRTFRMFPTLGASLLLPSILLSPPLALAHSGHGAPSVHAHAGSPSVLAVLAIAALGLAALVPLARLVWRRRLRRQG
ncbi:hypothetical protein BOX17_14295 [Halomonas aestuarii]|uniref:Uncharacterized protein n=1 Tax=Halomonas aestuarii TaxID=1897729 RepID=A0A1J0VJ15_9GAMM|nr:hypothetical protein [Halomonas aestuarii]APE32019.1 hypothetical protein BOX17_14295 [Halomonas aestuarii]